MEILLQINEQQTTEMFFHNVQVHRGLVPGGCNNINLVTIKPKLPIITEHYEIRNPVFHLPTIKHKFAESSLQYCLIKLINEQNCFNEMTDKVQKTSIYSFKVFLEQRVLDTYKSICKIDKCKTCAIINM